MYLPAGHPTGAAGSGKHLLPSLGIWGSSGDRGLSGPLPTLHCHPDTGPDVKGLPEVLRSWVEQNYAVHPLPLSFALCETGVNGFQCLENSEMVVLYLPPPTGVKYTCYKHPVKPRITAVLHSPGFFRFLLTNMFQEDFQA